jgi:hypothetical protein
MLRQILRALPVVIAIATLACPAFAGELEEKNKAVARIVFEEVLGAAGSRRTRSSTLPTSWPMGLDVTRGGPRTAKLRRDGVRRFPI